MNEKPTRRVFISGTSASLLSLSVFGSAAAPSACDAHAQTENGLQLTGPWEIQSSAARSSYRTTVPSTVFSSLVHAGAYDDDPYYGMNLRSIPGVTYPIGVMFANLDMSADSPFHASWWYRTTFELPRAFAGKHVALRVHGINYRANAWMNGRKIAGADELAGMWRAFEFDVTPHARTGANELAFEVFAPTPDDLALTFVDWNPMPPDKDMGLYRPVEITLSGPVTLRNPQVVTQLVSPERKRANLTIYGDLENHSGDGIDGVLRARFGGTEVSQRIRLAPAERRTIVFSPQAFPQLALHDAQLWWPAHMGEQPLHDLLLEFAIGGVVSDRARTRFGIREVTSEIDGNGHRLFSVNGKRMLVLGAGFTPDMMLRADPQRQEDEIRYVRDMHLNTIRLEGKIQNQHFFDLCDEYGIMVQAGWCCCDRWEDWKKWNAENYSIAGESLRAQLRNLRNHPCVLTWTYGSDNAPPPDVERIYLRVLHEERWPNPYQAAASARTTLVGTTGVKMTGPYDYVAPSYWLDPRAPGGASGYNSETSPGAAVPPVESLRKFIPADHLWPIGDVWDFHAGSGHFRNLDTFTHALEARYGKALDVDDYALKAQLMTYEGERAMFEAFRRNKYESTGVIQWMLNDAWPGLIWHLYDYFLCPGGGYFGTKKACEPVHVQYSYDDRSVVVTNELHRSFSAHTVHAKAFDVRMRRLFERSAQVDIAPDSITRVFTVPPIGNVPLYFVRLTLRDAGGGIVSSNVYWLSAKPDVFDWSGSTWYFTPLREYADFTALTSLPKVRLSINAQTRCSGGRCTADVTLHNPSADLAFFARASVRKGRSGEQILPVLWTDNYVTLLPGEQIKLQASYRALDLAGEPAQVTASGWNVQRD